VITERKKPWPIRRPSNKRERTGRGTLEESIRQKAPENQSKNNEPRIVEAAVEQFREIAVDLSAEVVAEMEKEPRNGKATAS
jgi:hypothetical protein